MSRPICLSILLCLTGLPLPSEALAETPSNLHLFRSESGSYVPAKTVFTGESAEAEEEAEAKDEEDREDFTELGRVTRLEAVPKSPHIETALSYFSAGANRNKAVESKSGYPFEGYNSKGTHRYTQPTNIGFYALLLANVIAGEVKSEHFSKADAKQALLKMMNSLLKDQSRLGFKGLMPWISFNGNSWRRAEGEPGKRVMFGDNANLSAALGTAIGALSWKALDDDVTVQAIKKKMKTFLSRQQQGYEFLYDPNEGKFHRGWNFAGKFWEGGHHDYFGDEFRSSLLFVMLEYNFPATVYEGLDVQIEDYTMASGKTVYTVAPYDGGAFQMLWPALTMPEPDNPALAKMLKRFVDIAMDFSKRRDLPGFLSASYTGVDRYSRNVGIATIAVNSRNRNQTSASLYTLGAARMIDPKRIDNFLNKILNDYPDLKTGHGFWEGVNKKGRVIKEQIVANVASFILGLIGNGPEQMTRYLKSRGLYPRLLQVWKSGEARDLIQDSTNAFTWGQAGGRRVGDDQYEVTAETFEASDRAFTAFIQNDANLSGRKLVIRYESNMDLGNVQLEFKKCPQGNCSQEQRIALQINRLDFKKTGGEEATIAIDLPATPALSGIDEVVAVVSGGTGKPLQLTLTDLDIK